jgi:hypothetical protein
MLKTLIIATVLLPRLAIAQQPQQLPQARQPGQWCPVGVDDERQLLRTGLRQGPGCYPQERLVSGWLARERQLLHPLICKQPASPAFFKLMRGAENSRGSPVLRI